MQAGTSMRRCLFLSALFVLAAPFALPQPSGNTLPFKTLGGEVVSLPGPGDQWTLTPAKDSSDRVTRTAEGKPDFTFAIILLPHDQPGDSCDFRVEGVNRKRNGSLYSHPELVPSGWPWLHSSMTDAKAGFLYATCFEMAEQFHLVIFTYSGNPDGADASTIPGVISALLAGAQRHYGAPAGMPAAASHREITLRTLHRKVLMPNPGPGGGWVAQNWLVKDNDAQRVSAIDEQDPNYVGDLVIRLLLHGPELVFMFPQSKAEDQHASCDDRVRADSQRFANGRFSSEAKALLPPGWLSTAFIQSDHNGSLTLTTCAISGSETHLVHATLMSEPDSADAQAIPEALLALFPEGVSRVAQAQAAPPPPAPQALEPQPEPVLKVTLKHAGLTLTIHDPDRFRSLRVGERRLPGESEVQDTLSLDGVTFRITRDDPNLCRAQAELEAGRTKSIGVRPMENTPENMEDPYGWTWFDWTATEYRGCMVCGDPAHYNLATSTHYSLIVPKNADGKPVERFLRWIQDGLELAGCKK